MARNGPEFEKMTMEKQKDNPKFSFLFGGEFYSYYKCKLALEQQQRESRQLSSRPFERFLSRIPVRALPQAAFCWVSYFLCEERQLGCS